MRKTEKDATFLKNIDEKESVFNFKGKVENK